MNSNYNSLKFLQFIWKWRKFLLIICIVTAIVTFLVSWIFIRPRYKSQAIIYGPRTNGLSQVILNENTYNERLDIKAYAIEEETEQMMQILKSRVILDSLISRYDLHSYYGIPLTKKYAKSLIYKILDDIITIQRTQYGAIMITVADWDPGRAAAMANDIVSLLDTVKNRAEYERASAAYRILKSQYDTISASMSAIGDSLKIIMDHGVFDVDEQTNRLTQQLAIAVAQGNNAAIGRIEKELENLAQYGGKSIIFKELQRRFSDFQALCRSKMLNAEMDMNSNMPVKFIVENAIAADKKIYPKKILITAVSTISVFLLSVFSLIIYENIIIIKATFPKKEEDC